MLSHYLDIYVDTLTNVLTCLQEALLFNYPEMTFTYINHMNVTSCN